MAEKEEVKITIKLLIDSKSNKVLFAEAGKECVDFFFLLLSRPTANMISLTEQVMVGSLGSLYNSLESLTDAYMQPNFSKAKWAALAPTNLLIDEAPNNGRKTFYGCTRSCSYSNVSDGEWAICPTCNGGMRRKMTYVAPLSAMMASSSCHESSQRGYVKDGTSYMIMDDLTVKPVSTISSIEVLKKFNVKDVGCLVEKMVPFDHNTGFALLKASLMSKTALTDVFLNANKAA